MSCISAKADGNVGDGGSRGVIKDASKPVNSKSERTGKGQGDADDANGKDAKGKGDDGKGTDDKGKCDGDKGRDGGREFSFIFKATPPTKPSTTSTYYVDKSGTRA